MEKITKAQLKYARTLCREKKARDESGLFVAEGEKILSDAVKKGYVPAEILISASFSKNKKNKSFIDKLRKLEVKTLVAGDQDLEQISSLKNSQGILGVLEKPEKERSFTSSGAEIIVLCDGVQDPGNMGSIIRTAIAFGVDTILVTGENADIYSPKVVRASSGAVLDAFLYKCTLEEIDELRDIGFKIFASSTPQKKSKSIEKLRLPSCGMIFAFGSEGKGLSKGILSRADEIFYIPIDKKVESLNVLSAVSATLFALKNSLS